MVITLSVKSFQHTLFDSSKSIKFLDVVALGLDYMVHLPNSVIFPACVLIVIPLVFTHVTSTHLGILHDEFFLELSKNAIIL